MQSGCRFKNIWSVLAIAGTVGAASAALASGPVKSPDRKPFPTTAKVETAPPQKGPETKPEPILLKEGMTNKAPEDNSRPAVLRGPGPANGLCVNAEVISVPGTAFGDTTGGAADPEATAACAAAGAASAGVWYTLTGNGSNIRVNTCAGAAFDTVLRVMRGNCGALVCVGSNDDFCGLSSQVEFLSIPGETYFVYVSAYGAASAGTFTLDVFDLGAPPPGPANDSCSGAIQINCNSTTIADNTSATVGPEDQWGCRVFGGQGFASIWYSFTATETSARIQTCSSVFPADDSIIEVYAGSCKGLFSIGCNDDGCNGLLSRLDLNNLNIGETYYIQLSAWGATDVGPYNLELICPAPQAGPGDVCATALPLGALPAFASGDTCAFEPNAGLPACGTGDASPSVWYSIEGNGGIFRATTCNGTFYDSALAVFTGDCGFLSCVVTNDDACGLQSTVTFPTNPGQTYYIVVRGFSSACGSYNLEVTDLGLPGPGDNCGTAFDLGALPAVASGNTCTATPEALFCGTGDSSPGVWYHMVGTGNTILAETCGGSFYDTALSVMTGSCDFLSCVASNDDACGLQSRVIFQTIPGVDYYIVVRGFSTACGDYTLTVNELLPPVNDECTDATLIFCNSSNPAPNLGATDNFAHDIYLCRVFGDNGTASVWFRFVATEDSAVVQTCNSFFPADDSILQVFSSNGDCNSLFPLPDGCNDDGCNGLLSRVIVRNLNVGATYYIMMSAWGPTDVGDYTLELICPAPPPAPGDDCVDAIDFGPVPGSVFGDTTTANPDSVDTCGTPGAASPGVWYRVTAPAGAERLRASTCDDASYDTVLRVYNGPCEFLSCITGNDDACPGFRSEVRWDVVPGTEYLVWVGGFGSASGTFTLVIDEPPPPCELVAPPGAVIEDEPNCGIPDDFVNGGCNSVPPVFGTISCNVPIFGSSAYDGFTRDTDWYELTLAEPATITITMSSEFAGAFGVVGDAFGPVPQGPSFCAQITQITIFAVTADDCMPVEIQASLGAGTWVLFAGPLFTNPAFACGSSGGDYILSVTGCGGDDTDCNNNGIPDDQEIAGGARDCFNPLVVTNPHSMGGSDGFLDDCQCLANWNRDAMVNSGDITAFLTSWLDAVGGGPTNADVNCDGLSNSGDITFFLTKWLAAVQGSDPIDGCP